VVIYVYEDEMLQQRFNDWLDERRGLGNITETTAQNYRVFCKDFLDRHGVEKLPDITAKKITAWYIHRLKTCSPSTVRIAHQVLAGFFSWCVEQGDLPASPMSKVQPPRSEKAERKALSEEQIKQLLDYVADKPFTGLVIRLALATGLRRGELAALRWRDLDLTTGRLTISKAIVKIGSCEIETRPKTAAGTRIIALPSSMIAELKVLYATPDASLLLTSVGQRPSLAHLSRVVGDAMTAVGLGEGFCLHSVRHSHATQLLRKKLPVKAVSQRLGHSDITTTLRTYAHVFAADDNELAQAMEDIIACQASPA
jgi:integrase